MQINLRYCIFILSLSVNAFLFESQDENIHKFEIVSENFHQILNSVLFLFHIDTKPRGVNYSYLKEKFIDLPQV